LSRPFEKHLVDTTDKPQRGIAEDGYSGNSSHLEEETNVAFSLILNVLVFTMMLLCAEP
jgi:hypothetical protein